MKSAAWNGSWPVMLTAFADDLTIDWRGIDALTDWYLESGSSGLFSACLSSEATSLTVDEIVDLVTRVVKRTAGRVPIAAGAMSAISTGERLELARRLHDAGADVVVLVTNDFARPEESDEVVSERLSRFAAAVRNVPLGLYECPVPYKRLLSPRTLGDLARSGRFWWLKETSCDASMIAQKVEACRTSPLRIFNANLGLLTQAIELGAAGFSGILANFFPRLAADLCAKAANRDAGLPQQFEVARTIDMHLEETYSTAYPAVAKYCAARQGVPISERTRIDARVLNHAARAIVDRFVGQVVS